MMSNSVKIRMVVQRMMLALLMIYLAVAEVPVYAESIQNCTVNGDIGTKGNNSTPNQTDCVVTSPDLTTSTPIGETANIESENEDFTGEPENHTGTSVTRTPLIILSTTSENEVTTHPLDRLGRSTLNPLYRDWKQFFQIIHHFSGHYTYDGKLFWITFIVRYVHPHDSETLVANFYDDVGGAILEMNGTYTGNKRVTFTMSKMFAADDRFILDQNFQLDGLMDQGGPVYMGNITRPKNSSFSTFYLESSIGEVNYEEHTVALAVVIGLPVGSAALLIVITFAVICWAYRRGYLGRGRHKAYKLFSNNPVQYEAEAECIHI